MAKDRRKKLEVHGKGKKLEWRRSVHSALGLRHRLGFPNGLAVGAVGQSGGLALFWRGDVVVALRLKVHPSCILTLSCHVRL